MNEPTPPTSRDTYVPPEPFLKWAGGKRQLLPELDRHLGPAVEHYIEPFIGGGAVFFHLKTRPSESGRPPMTGTAVIGDANGELVRAYATVAADVERVIEFLQHYRNDEAQFYEVRDKRDPKDLDDAMRTARFIYLNRVCFNGLYRENKSGKFNVPFGRYKNPTICNAVALRAASKVLKSCAAIIEADFVRVVQAASALVPLGRSTIYCDPPYVPLTKSADFSQYQAKGFGPGDQVRLRDAALQWAKSGARVILSNHDVPIVRELYAGGAFEIHGVKAKRSINSKADLRGEVGEVIIVSTSRP